MHIAGFPISRLKQPNLDIKKNAYRRFLSPTSNVGEPTYKEVEQKDQPRFSGFVSTSQRSG